ncbi:hypothetical protein Tco_1019655 [Tanacetum coccineum]|uniref:Uncharacterized protein n=1 Tax=Tanacetum coccineum TaxID=301880 RepID=A0ABQ5FZ74_9ASTR
MVLLRIHIPSYQEENGGSSVLDSDSDFSSSAIALNLSNFKKISSSIRVPLMEWRILLPSSRRAVDIKDHLFSPNSKIELFLFNSNNCISNVKKGSSQDEGNFTVFFHFKNSEIGRKISRDSFAYTEYGIRLMLAPILAKALQEKVLLKLHGMRKLPSSLSFGRTLFWIIAELSSLRKAAEIIVIAKLGVGTTTRSAAHMGSSSIGSIGIKSFLMLFGITTVLIDVNAAQSKLVPLENFNENYSNCLRLLVKLQLSVQSYYC